MKNISRSTAESRLEFYNKGCQHNPALDPTIKPLNLSEQDQPDIIEFLKPLNGRYEVE